MDILEEKINYEIMQEALEESGQRYCPTLHDYVDDCGECEMCG